MLSYDTTVIPPTRRGCMPRTGADYRATLGPIGRRSGAIDIGRGGQLGDFGEREEERAAPVQATLFGKLRKAGNHQSSDANASAVLTCYHRRRLEFLGSREGRIEIRMRSRLLLVPLFLGLLRLATFRGRPVVFGRGLGRFMRLR